MTFVKGKIFKRDLLFLNIVTIQLCSIQEYNRRAIR